MQKMYDEGLVTDEFMLETIRNHTNVIYQPLFDSPHYSGINPYTLGFGIYNDIRRICEHPTAEDRKWFPDLAGSDWVSALMFAMQNFKDESFILQYLSPKLMRDLKLFAVVDEEKNPELIISAIHEERGYQRLREALAAQYNLANLEPNIQIYNVNRRGDRALTLRHVQHQQRPLSLDTEAVLKHLHKLWGFTVYLETVTADDIVESVMRFPK
jgi:spore cortex formation protein SpoVR/YcgB (stage V sporulation)